MISLPINKTTYLKAEDPKYKRGLAVKYNKDGSYDMEYWFDKKTDIYPVEVEVDGKSVKKDARKVSMLYHPELGVLTASTEGTYLERFIYYWDLNPFDLPPEVDKSWEFASYVYSEVATFLLEYKISLPNSLSGAKSWVDSNRLSWEFAPVSGASDYYISQKTSIKRSHISSQREVFQNLMTPSFFLVMGFSNLKEFYAFASFICAWIYSIDNTNISAKQAGTAFVKLYSLPPQDEKEKFLFQTPVTTSRDRLSSYADDLMNYLSHYIVNVIEPLFNSSTSSVQGFFNQMIIDSRDTIALAGETKKFVKQESNDDLLKYGIGIVIALGAFSLLRK